MAGDRARMAYEAMAWRLRALAAERERDETQAELTAERERSRKLREDRPMATHDLETWPEFFEAVRAGRKTFEVRKNDRGFQAGDTLVLLKYDPNRSAYVRRNGEHTKWPEYADSIRARITYVLSGVGIESGYVVLGLAVEGGQTDGE